MPFDQKNFILEARKAGVPDETTFNYLKEKGLIGQADIVRAHKPVFTPQDTSEIGGSTIGAFAKELPGATAQVLAGVPAKFIASVAEAPGTIARSFGGQDLATTQKTYNLPGLQPFKSYQSEAETMAGKISQGEEPLWKSLTPFAEVPLAGLETYGGVQVAKGAIKGGLEGIKGVRGMISNIIKGKSEQEILATAEKNVSSLNPTERKIWFDNKQAEITTQSEATTKQIKQTLSAQGESTTKATENLQKQLAKASRDKVIELRPKIVKAMGEQSKIYRGLIAEELAGKEGVPVSTNDLKAFIDNQYADNPGMAGAIKDRLGLIQAPEILKKGQIPTIQEGATKTLGDLYNQTKSLGQDISTAATKGTKVFTPDDKLTDDAIHVLTNFMKNNGVDFTEANKFWSRYAPIRDQLVSEAKPFLQTGTKTKTFAQTLTNVSKETDVNNENFINQVESLLGEQITKENKAIVAKLSENAKATLVNKIAAEEKFIGVQMAKNEALGKLSSQQFEVERQARMKLAVKNAIKSVIKYTVGGVAGLEVLRRTTSQ